MTDHEQPSAATDTDELRPTPLPADETLVQALADEASDESFPASDPPSSPAATASRTDDAADPPPTRAR